MKTADLLIGLGFQSISNDSYELNLGNCQLKAFEVLDVRTGHTLHFAGSYFGNRTAGIIQ